MASEDLSHILEKEGQVQELATLQEEVKSVTTQTVNIKLIFHDVVSNFSEIPRDIYEEEETPYTGTNDHHSTPPTNRNQSPPTSDAKDIYRPNRHPSHHNRELN